MAQTHVCDRCPYGTKEDSFDGSDGNDHRLTFKVRIKDSLAADIKVIHIQRENLLAGDCTRCKHDYTVKRDTAPTRTPHTCNSSCSRKRIGDKSPLHVPPCQNLT